MPQVEAPRTKSGSPVRGIHRLSAVSETPIASSSMKISRQPAASAIRAPIMGAVTGAMPWMAPTTAIRVASSLPACNRAGHHDRTRGAEPLEKAHRDEGLDVGRKNRTRRRERKDREARRERNPAPAGVGKRTDPELSGGKPPHRGGKTELHHRGGRAEVDRLIRKRRKIEVGHERTKGGEKRQEDDQKGTGVSRRALFVNGCHFCSVLVRCGCRMRRRRIERRLGLRVDDPIPSANLVRILRLA